MSGTVKLLFYGLPVERVKRGFINRGFSNINFSFIQMDERVLCFKESQEMLIGMIIGSAHNNAGISLIPDRCEYSLLKNVLSKDSFC